MLGQVQVPAGTHIDKKSCVSNQASYYAITDLVAELLG